MDTPKTERIVFVGCVHQTGDSLVKRLQALQKCPPDYLIFGGDVTGSTELEEFKRLFYNHVYNRARRELGLGTPQQKNLSDQELLDYVGPNPPHEGCTLRCGYYDLRQYQRQLEGYSPQSARSLAEGEPDQSAAAAIRDIAANYEYYGPWVRTLPEPVRRGVVKTIEADARRLSDAVAPLQNAGTKVAVCGGNWDNAEVTREHMAGPGIEVFDTVPFFRNQGFQFHEIMGCLETKGALIVFAPYWELNQWTAASNQRLHDAQKLANVAIQEHKTVILVGHAEANWKVHSLTSENPDRLPTGDRGIVVERFNHVIASVRPDEVVYPHQHNPIVNGDGRQVDVNAQYILEVLDDGSISLLEDTSRFGQPFQIIASYLPFQCFGELALPFSGNRRPTLFGGQRQPVFVS